MVWIFLMDRTALDYTIEEVVTPYLLSSIVNMTVINAWLSLLYTKMASRTDSTVL